MKSDKLRIGRLIHKKGDTSNCLMIIKSGNVEVTSLLDGTNRVIIENLTDGAVIGANTFMNRDVFHVDATCRSLTEVYLLSAWRLDRILETDELMNNKI